MHSLYCAKWPNTLKVVNPELHSKGDRKRGLEEGKAFILDLLVEFETLVDGESIHQSAIVEMQTTDKKNFAKRVLAYACRTYIDEIGKGDEYEKLKRVYSVVFTTANLSQFKGLPEHYHIASIRREGEEDRVYMSDLKFVVVELGKFTLGIKELVDSLDRWCYFLKHSSKLDDEEIERLKEDKTMARALQNLAEISSDGEIRRQLDAIDRFERDMVAKSRYREERAEARGIKKGKAEGICQTALEFLRAGIEMATVKECTGLSEAELKKLASQAK